MTSLSEQLSAVHKSQWEAQLDILQAFGSRAIDSAEQFVALNLRASRTSVEQATGTFKQLLDATNPRDVIAVGSRAQGQWHYLFEYGRELLSIASGLPLHTWTTQPAQHVLSAPLQLAHTANVPTSVSQVLDQVSIATADATTVTSEIAAAAADTGAALAQAGLHAGQQAVARATAATEAPAEHVQAQAQATTEQAADAVDNATAAAYEAAQAAPQPDPVLEQVEAAIETAIADEVPHAKAKPVAEALNEVAPKPASVEHPIASPVALEVAHDQVELPHVTPQDATPPLQVSRGPAAAKERRTRSRK